MKLSVIIVSWNTCELLQRCLSQLQAELLHLPISSEVILVDNNSHDGSVAMVRRCFPNVNLVVNQDNRGFGSANNQAFTIARGEMVLLLNPDTEVLPGSLRKLIDFMDAQPKAGIVAPQLINSDGSVQRSCREFPTVTNMFYELSGFSRLFPRVALFRRYKMLDFDHQSTRQVDQPEGACLLIRKQVLDEVGWFDESFFMLFEEVDLCYRTKQAGWQIWFYSGAQIIHHYGQSIKQVKAKMILHSHKGMYRYWTKHNRGVVGYIARPFLAAGLFFLALVRIMTHWLKSNYVKNT